MNANLYGLWKDIQVVLLYGEKQFTYSMNIKILCVHVTHRETSGRMWITVLGREKNSAYLYSMRIWVIFFFTLMEIFNVILCCLKVLHWTFVTLKLRGNVSILRRTWLNCVVLKKKFTFRILGNRRGCCLSGATLLGTFIKRTNTFILSCMKTLSSCSSMAL